MPEVGAHEACVRRSVSRLGLSHESSVTLDLGVAWRHTIGMKVAISIPDEVFIEGEALAKQFKTSRSELYRRALGEFIGRHAPDPVTLAMNQALDAIGGAPDEFSRAAARRVLKQVEW